MILSKDTIEISSAYLFAELRNKLVKKNSDPMTMMKEDTINIHRNFDAIIFRRAIGLLTINSSVPSSTGERKIKMASSAQMTAIKIIKIDFNVSTVHNA
jgi:hypothetical protein